MGGDGLRKDRNKKKTDRIAKILDVPKNIYENFAQIILSGNREAILDGCQGVIEYEENKIKLKIGKQAVTFCGDSLQIKCMTDDTVIIEGKLSQLQFEE